MATVTTYGPPIVYSDFNLKKYPELAQFIGAPPPGGPGAGSTTFGTAPTNYTPAYGGIPTVPSPTTSASTAVTGNLKNLPDVKKYGRQLNAFNFNQLLNQIRAGVPNYNARISQEAANNLAALQGRVSDDVLYQLRQHAAEFGVGQGQDQGGTDAMWDTLAGRYGLLSLGTTSRAEQQRGAENLRADIAGAPRVNLFDPTTMAVTPQQQQEAELLAALYRSFPDPRERQLMLERLARAGINLGQGSVPPPPGGGGGGAPPPGTTSTSNMLAGLIQQFGGAGGGGAPTSPGTTPTGPSWGYAPGINGPVSSGNVPGWVKGPLGQVLPATGGPPSDDLYA